MPELAPSARLLAIEVKFGLGDLEDRLDRRKPPDQVHHRSMTKRFGRAEGEPHNRPQMILELARACPVQSPVA